MLQKILQERIYSLTFMLILIGLAASISFPNTFPTFENLSQILLNLSIDTIVAVGMMLLLVSGAFDLSVGSIVAFTGCLAAYLLYFLQLPVPIAITISLIVSMGIGLINGYLIAYQGINPMIQTLAMMGIVRGGALMLSGAGIQDLPYWFNAIGQSKFMGIQMPVWYMIILGVLRVPGAHARRLRSGSARPTGGAGARAGLSTDPARDRSRARGERPS